MFLSKGKFGWYVPIKSKDMGGNELTQNLQITWKKGCEPGEEELTRQGSIPCRMYIETDHERRECFFGVYQRKDGETGLKIVILKDEWSKPKKEGGLEIDESELPFY